MPSQHPRKKTTRQLAQFAYSDETLEASMSFAAINSMLDVDESAAREMNASETLTNVGQGKNAALVGHFPSSHNYVKASVNSGSSKKIQRRMNIPPKLPLI